MSRSLSLLIGGTVVIWLVVVYPAWRLWGDSAVFLSATAALLCLIPTAATLIWAHLAFRGLPEQQLLAVLGGTGLRLVFVLAAGMGLFYTVPEFHYQRFWLWIIAFYLATLTLEMGILSSRPASPDHSRKN